MAKNEIEAKLQSIVADFTNDNVNPLETQVNLALFVLDIADALKLSDSAKRRILGEEVYAQAVAM